MIDGSIQLLHHDTATSRLHTHTHARRQRHTRANTFCHHTVSNSLRFASLTSTSQSLCTAAGEADTHSHTLSHTRYLPRSTPIFFGREEMRREQTQGSTAFFALSEELPLNLDFQADDSGISFLALKVLSKIFGSIIISKGICSTRQDRGPTKIRKGKKEFGPV